MRIDVYLKLIGIFKTRSAAGRAASAGYVSSGDRVLKPSHAVVAGDILRITRADGSVLSIRIADVPASGQVPRRERAKYYDVLEGPD